MKIAVGITVGLIALAFWQPGRTEKLHVSATPIPGYARRAGVNLGLWTSWGAEQLAGNILKNPGFEPTLDRAIVIVEQADSHSFMDDTDWVARPPSFWDGGRYSIRTGNRAGQEGAIARSSVSRNKAQFEVKEDLTGLLPGDIVAVTREATNDLPAQWWYASPTAATGDSASRRPGSAGIQSLHLQTGYTSSYVDAIGDRAGKLLPLNGTWELSFWVRGSQPSGTLSVRLQRAGSTPGFQEHVPVTAEWRQIRRGFTPGDDGPAVTLELRFEIADTDVWLDDVSLRRDQDQSFRSEVEATLRTLSPGYLRDWQGQLGDTFANRLADPAGRRPSRYRPGNEAVDYFYSLPEFLELCSRIKAEPWVVLPTTLSDDEWLEAGWYLSVAASRYGFREVVVEFGDENWNSIFRPAGIPNPAALRAASDRAFTLLSKGARGDVRLRPLIGLQSVSSGSLRSLGPGTLPAIAPYWALQGDAVAGARQLFADRTELLRTAAQSSASIYAMNASLLSGPLSDQQTNELVTSRASGSAMAWHILAAISAGIPRQCIWTLSGFDVQGDGGRLVRLFGLTRDLTSSDHLRPTGMAIAMLNRIVAPRAFSVDAKSPEITSVAFFQRAGWQAAIASRSDSSARVRLEFPGFGALPLGAISLGEGDPLANNEDQPRVREETILLTRSGRAVEVDLPAYGFVILTSERSKI